ncbi:hypothetical protein [Fibrella forsythiae]|uniref:DUF3098 domain-containing protein n=1 Tax=Fibrella forsythiae TaxID=2817061 RepID=A0ABS3JID9_9BACT|nr:hypothetical protein [Fibrella forsythiae]MBO0949773.1 hypothetical protein [Fibrella forsythiae]
MNNRFIIQDFSEFSLDELKKQEHSQKMGVRVVSSLLILLLIVTIVFWIRQDFSFTNSGPFNPVLYCGPGLVSLGSVAIGMAKTLTIVRAEISARS